MNYCARSRYPVSSWGMSECNCWLVLHTVMCPTQTLLVNTVVAIFAAKLASVTKRQCVDMTDYIIALVQMYKTPHNTKRSGRYQC